MSLGEVQVKVYLGLLVACGCNAIFGLEQPTLDDGTNAGQGGTAPNSGGVSSGGRGGASAGGVSNGAGGNSGTSSAMGGDTSGAGEAGAWTGGSPNANGGANANGGSSANGGVTGSGGTAVGRGGSSAAGNGGTSAGGASSGGKSSAGGASSGGKSSAGGTTSSGGTSMGGRSAGGSGPTNPPGYWTQGSLRGCVWVDTDHNSPAMTTVMPQDFTAKAAPPYCIKGSVGGYADYSGIAMLSFNLAQPAPNNCAYNPDNGSTSFPTVAVSGTGVAFTLTKNTASPLRMMLYGANPDLHWCSVITTAASGKVFVPFSSFNSECWTNEGAPYSNEPIATIVYYVYGTGQGGPATPYDFCVNGPVFGTSASAAP